MPRIVEYEERDGSRPFAKWFLSLNVQAALKIRTALARMEQGNFSNAKPVGQGVSEYRVNFGPGYRIYYGRDGNELTILLGGGAKKQQYRDIQKAYARWQAYKSRKMKE